MTLKRAATSLQRYGVRGVLDWLVRKIRHDPNRTYNALKCHIAKGLKPRRGITIIGDLSSHTSLSKVLRDLICSLREANIPHQACDTAKPIPDDFVINRYTNIFSMFQDFHFNEMPDCQIYRIVFWEFDTGFDKCHPDLIDGNPLLVFSEYCRDSLRTQIHRNTTIRYIRYPFHFKAPPFLNPLSARKKIDVPDNAFIVFFNFDYRSSYYRKNPEGLLLAFIEAFPDTQDAFLVFKTIGSTQKPTLRDKLESLAAKSAVSSRVRFINDYISTSELVSLVATCNIYASLHRGEGFGLGIAEAMSMGKAVVVSDCGATNEFCHSDTAELVPHRTINILPEQIDHPDYTWVGRWPEPNIHAAAHALRTLYDNPKYCIELGLRAQKFIKNHYSIESFKKSMLDFFES